MVCNGEIYNYRELKDQLVKYGYNFKTKTDTEVILHGYEEWGTNLWNKLNGIFSIVIWDGKEKKLFLVRDHLGVKPLHYLFSGSRIYFGSDYNAFFAQTYQKPQMNKNAILSYLSFRYSIGEQTFYDNINDVLPGNLIMFNNGKKSVNSYWDFPLNTGEDKGEKYYLDKLDEKLSLSVKRQLMSDVPLGAFISGGLDSSLLLYYLCQNQPDLKAFITGFEVEGYNEFKYADIMAENLDFKLRKLVLSPEEYMSNMDEIISYRGEPVSVPHEAAFLKMTRYMKKEITVVISGEGADELFGGYGRIFRSPFDYYKHKNIDSMGRLFKGLDPLGEFGPFKKPMDHFLWRYSWFNENDKIFYLDLDYFDNKLFDNYSLSYINELFNKVNDGRDYYQAMYYLQGKIHLPNLLNRLDRMSMAASVEARVPFLDYELVEFVSRMPIKYKNRWKNNLSKLKSVFLNSEKISEKYDIPKYILKLLAKGKIPDSIIWRKKMGFPVPLDNWFNKGFNNYAKELLLDNGTKIKDLLNIKGIENILSSNQLSSDYDYDGKRIWMLVNLELWMKKYF
jgi:asparagine synthase (glutamine-hydrolysing)